MAKRKIQKNIATEDIATTLRALAENVENGKIELAGKEAALEGFENFSISFKQTNAGVLLKVKVKHPKAESE